MSGSYQYQSTLLNIGRIISDINPNINVSVLPTVESARDLGAKFISLTARYQHCS